MKKVTVHAMVSFVVEVPEKAIEELEETCCFDEDSLANKYIEKYCNQHNLPIEYICGIWDEVDDECYWEE